MSRASLLATPAGLLVLLAGHAAEAQTRTTAAATATVGVGYSRNPYLLVVPDGGTGSSQVSVQPTIAFSNGTTQGAITGNYSREDYFAKFPSADGYGVTGTLSKQPSERTSFSLSASFDSSILGSAGGFGLTSLATTPIVPATGSTSGAATGGTSTGTVTPVDPVVVPSVAVLDSDIGLIGLRQRRNTFNVGAGLSYRPTELSSWTFGANFVTSSYPGGSIFADNYRNYGASIGYSRSLSSTTSLGLQVSGSYVDYNRGTNSKTITPQITFSKTLSNRWNLSAAVGAGVVSSDFGTEATLSANLSLCRSYERGQFCFAAAQQPGISGFGGVRGQTNLSASYTRQIAERTSLSAAASFTHTGNGLIAAPGGGTSYSDFYQVSGTIQHQIGRRLSLVGSTGYRNVSGIGNGIPADIFGRIGLSVSVGGGRI